MTFRAVLVAARAAVALGVLAPSIAAAAVVDRIAAVVNDEVITLSEVYDIGAPYIEERCPLLRAACVHDMELEVLDALIKRVLIRGELDRLELRVGGQEIDQAIDQVVRENGMADRQALRAELEREGIEWGSFRDDLADQLRQQRFQQSVLMPRVMITEDEVKDVYKRTERSSRKPEVTLDAFGMIIPADADEEAANAVIARAAELVASVNAGELPWEQAVEANDEAQLSGVVGGRSYPRGELNAKVDEAAFSGEVGKAVGPVRVGNVLFVLKIIASGLGEARVVPYEEVADQLRNQLFRDKLAQAEAEWYQRARRLSAVEVLLEGPGD